MLISKLFVSKYLKGEDLQGRSVTVTIERCTLEKMGQTQEAKPVLWFTGARKALVLNRTNALSIARIYGDETDLWKGKPITLTAVQIRAFGESHTVVRVSPNQPTKPTSSRGAPWAPIQPEPEEAALDDAEDILDDIDDVPFTHREPIQSDDEGRPLAPIQPDGIEDRREGPRGLPRGLPEIRGDRK